MFLPPEFQPRKTSVLFKEDYENSPGHAELTERLCKTLYYGKNPNTERPSLPVTEMCVEFFQEATPRGLGKVDPFFASSVGRRACISPCSMMLGMIYIDRLKKRNPEYLQAVSSSDLFLISMMVASKYLYDEGVDEEVFNDEWAESAKIDTDDVNDLEVNFLAAIDWSLFVKPGEFQEMLHDVEKKIAMQQGFDRGWLSYMDLLVLMEDDRLCKLMHNIALAVTKVIVVCSVAYVAGALTLVAASVSLVYVRTHLPPPQLVTPGSSHRFVHAPDAEKRPPVAYYGHNVEGNLEIDVSSDMYEDSEEQSANNTNETQSEHHVARTGGFENMDGSGHGHEQTDHNKRLSFPGLMTLVLIRDTVSNVLVSMFTKTQQSSHSVSPDSSGLDEECSCAEGPCVGADSSNCRNFSNVLDYENWCLACLPLFNMEGDDNTKFTGAIYQLPYYHHGSRPIPKSCRSRKSVPYAFPVCCCRNEIDLWDKGGTTVSNHFSDIMLGFGTTVKPV